MTEAPPSTTQPPHTERAPALARRVRVGRVVVLFGWAWLLVAVGVLLFGCSTTERVDTNEGLLMDQPLTTEQEIQNAVSLPFRILGGAIIYPLKLLFYDIPNAIGGAFATDLDAPMQRLKSPDAATRELGVLELAEAGDATAVPALTALLDDPSSSVRRQALLALAALGDASLEPEILPFVYDTEPIVRAAALYALGSIGTEVSWAPVRAKLADENEHEIVRAYALLALAQLRAPEAEEAMLATLDDASLHPNWHAHALLGLGYIGSDRAVRTVVMYVIPAPTPRGADGRASPPPATSTIDDRLVIAAATALGVARRFDLLLEIAHNDRALPTARHTALLALGEHGGASYIPILERFAQADDRQLRLHGLFAIALAGDPHVCATLIELLQDPDPWTRLRALSFLRRLTAQSELGIDPTPWKKWWAQHGDDVINRYEWKKERGG